MCAERFDLRGAAVKLSEMFILRVRALFPFCIMFPIHRGFKSQSLCYLRDIFSIYLILFSCYFTLKNNRKNNRIDTLSRLTMR